MSMRDCHRHPTTIPASISSQWHGYSKLLRIRNTFGSMPVKVCTLGILAIMTLFQTSHNSKHLTIKDRDSYYVANPRDHDLNSKISHEPEARNTTYVFFQHLPSPITDERFVNGYFPHKRCILNGEGT